MSFLDYLKGKVIPLIILIGALVFISLMLWVLGVSLTAILVVAFIFFIAVGASFVWDYLARRRFYTELNKANESTTENYYMSELIYQPGFYEGDLTYEVIDKATKDMNDKIATYRISSEEYREYIESWIHEVKTPLSSARLTLANNSDSELARPLTHDIDRIEAYVEQALYYSRSTAVEKDYLIKAVNLDKLVKATVKKHSLVLIESGITPEFEGLDKVVYSDSKWLDFILGQIIVNAIKYRKRDDEPNPRIVFKAERLNEGFEQASVALHISDNGIGIPESDRDRVFEKGFTGENGRHYARSTGLGLYLCKKLSEKMKLGLSIASLEGEGTTVSLVFPVSKMYFLEDKS